MPADELRKRSVQFEMNPLQYFQVAKLIRTKHKMQLKSNQIIRAHSVNLNWRNVRSKYCDEQLKSSMNHFDTVSHSMAIGQMKISK